MRGCILAQLALLVCEGCIIFAEMGHLVASAVMLSIFSIFEQGSEQSTYGNVPYINRVLWFDWTE